MKILIESGTLLVSTLALFVSVLALIVSIWLQISSWSRHRKSVDIDFYIKLIDLIRNSHYKLVAPPNLDIDYEFYVVDYLNLIDSLIRLYYDDYLPALTKGMLKDELRSNIMLIERQEKIKEIMEKNKTSHKTFEYIEKFKNIYLFS